MKKFEFVLIKGDGIGPEIADAVVQIFDAAAIPIKWIEKNAGLSVLEKHPTGIPQETFEAIRKYKVALKGPTATPVGTGWEPLQAQFDKLHMAPGWYVGERSVTRWRKAGRIPLITADEICCRVFRLHPYEVYGDDYFGGSDGT